MNPATDFSTAPGSRLPGSKNGMSPGIGLPSICSSCSDSPAVAIPIRSARTVSSEESGKPVTLIAGNFDGQKNGCAYVPPRDPPSDAVLSYRRCTCPANGVFLIVLQEQQSVKSSLSLISSHEPINPPIVEVLGENGAFSSMNYRWRWIMGGSRSWVKKADLIGHSDAR